MDCRSIMLNVNFDVTLLLPLTWPPNYIIKERLRALASSWKIHRNGGFNFNEISSVFQHQKVGFQHDNYHIAFHAEESNALNS
jgi:hypothetical protein